MKFICEYELLLKIVQMCEKVAGKKESLPVLSCLVFRVEKNTCTAQATNLETGIQVTFPVTAAVGGVCAIPASILSQVIKNTPKEKICFEVTGSHITITTSKSETKIKTVSHEEFPFISKTHNTKKLQIKKQVCIDGIQHVSYAAAQSTIRPEFASIYIQFLNTKVIFAATDSFRLAEKKTNYTNDIEKEILLPVKNALDLVFILGLSNNQNIDISFDESQMIIETENSVFITRTIDAQFPNYHTIIPKQFSSELTVLKEDFVTILKKMRVFNSLHNTVSFAIRKKEKKVFLHTKTQEIGECKEYIDAVIEGDDLDINFNNTYLYDCMSSIISDSIVLRFAGQGKPLVIQGLHDASFMYLVMPLNK